MQPKTKNVTNMQDELLRAACYKNFAQIAQEIVQHCDGEIDARSIFSHLMNSGASLFQAAYATKHVLERDDASA